MAGAAAGIATLYAWRMMPRIRFGARRHPPRAGAWERKVRREEDEQREVDRILAKVSVSGVHSLTWRERRTLARATKRQQRRDRELGRTDRI